MNTVRVFRGLVASALIGVASWAQADVSPNDITSAVTAHNLPRAESLAQQATQEHPNSGKAWYLLAQVEERLNKPNEGLAALQRAEQLKPDLSFAKSPEFVSQLQNQLQFASQLQNQLHREPANAASGNVSRAPTFQSQRTLSTAPVIAARPSQTSHFPWGIVIVVLLLIGAIVTAIVVMGRRKTATQREAQRQDAQRVMADAQTRAMALQQTIRFEGKTSSQLANDVADVLSAINTELTHLKSTSGDAWLGRDRQRDQAVRALSDAERRQRSGSYDTIAPAARTATERIADADLQAQQAQQRRDEQVRAQQNPGYNPVYQGGYQGPQPVVINNGNNSDGLLTGMMLGEMMGGRDRVVERDVYVDRGDRRDNSWDDDNRRRPAPEPEPDPAPDSGLFDSGSGGNNWDDSSSSSDSGGSSGWDDNS